MGWTMPIFCRRWEKSPSKESGSMPSGREPEEGGRGYVSKHEPRHLPRARARVPVPASCLPPSCSLGPWSLLAASVVGELAGFALRDEVALDGVEGYRRAVPRAALDEAEPMVGEGVALPGVGRDCRKACGDEGCCWRRSCSGPFFFLELTTTG